MRAPFRVLFSNDTTNTLTCTSPYHKEGDPFQPEMLEATVDEVAGTGVEVHMIQLAHGAVPWYQSKVYPMKEHLDWWRSHYGADPMTDPCNVVSVNQYVLDGGDLLKIFIDRCRKTGQVPFLSVRMNDVHFVNHAREKGNVLGTHALSRFYVENLDCRIGDDPKDWLQRGLDWRRDAVRDYMFSLIEEQCENYDIDGLELDFMRMPSYFRQQETTSEQRVGIMTAFVERVRALLDRTAPGGRRRWLCVRVPAYLAAHDRIGLDVAKWTAAGVDMVNLSYHYFTEQRGDLAAIRELAPDASVYAEMTHTTAYGSTVTDKEHDNFSFRRTTQPQFNTTAHLARARGLDGISVFNFVYYRPHGGEERGPFDEPPFEVFNHIGDADWLALQPQHYFLGCVLPRPLPQEMSPGQTARFTMDMAPPTGGWVKAGRLRIQCRPDQIMEHAACQASFNGTPLSETDDRSEPFGAPYSPLIGTPERHRAWIVPQEIMKDGINEIEIRYTEGPEPIVIVFVDLAVE